MTKRAAIYVRVSTEAQSERVSPAEQENDCRAHCERLGYRVVEVYKDIMKYRSKGHIVEPSGTRADRPALKAMLADARDDRFDVIVAWREDRLYRGFAPLALVGNMLDETDVDIELVRETFDRRMMGLRASIAKLELDAIRERTAMGIGARLREGKLYMSNPVYGYSYDPESGTLVINEEEARWVRAIWQWFGEGIGKAEIRRRLIGAGAQQRQATTTVKSRVRPWSIGTIEGILYRNAYYTGVWKQKWGKVEGTKQPRIFEFTIPTIIDATTYEVARQRSAQWKKHPAGNWLNDTGFLAGKVYCAHCGCKMGLDKKVINGKRYDYYRCGSSKRRDSPPECCKSIRVDDLDRTVWALLWGILTTPERFTRAVEERLLQLEAEEVDAQAEVARLEQQIGDLAMERQRVIAWARKGIITEDDLAAQLLPLNDQERDLQRQLQERRLLTGGRADRLRQMADTLLMSLATSIVSLAPANKPANDQEAREHFATKRKFVELLVPRVDVYRDGSTDFHFALGVQDVTNGLGQDLLIPLVGP